MSFPLPPHDASATPPGHAGCTSDTLTPLQRLALGVLRAVVPTYHGLSVVGDARLPASGPAIIASNHTSALDPLIIQTLTPRLIRWMCAREYTQIPGTAPFWRAAEVIPVRRDGRDAAALRAALRVLDRGQLLGVFPEGRLQPTRELLPLQPGVALLVRQRPVPVVPVWIDGIQRRQPLLQSLLLPQDATVCVGPPLSLDPADPDPLAQLARRLDQLRETSNTSSAA
ncbi:MAG: lysophospholipid acyltransferase family protein [Tepidisphaerales bacterium]